MLLDLLRFALSAKRYQGEVTALLAPPVVEAPKPKKENKRRRRRLWRPRLRRFRFRGSPFTTMSLFMAVVVLMTSVAPSVALAASPASGPDPQRLFIEEWRVEGD